MATKKVIKRNEDMEALDFVSRGGKIEEQSKLEKEEMTKEDIEKEIKETEKKIIIDKYNKDYLSFKAKESGNEKKLKSLKKDLAKIEKLESGTKTFGEKTKEYGKAAINAAKGRLGLAKQRFDLRKREAIDEMRQRRVDRILLGNEYKKLRQMKKGMRQEEKMYIREGKAAQRQRVEDANKVERINRTLATLAEIEATRPVGWERRLKFKNKRQMMYKRSRIRYDRNKPKGKRFGYQYNLWDDM